VNKSESPNACSRRNLFMAALGVFVCLCAAAPAQTVYGSIRGTVTGGSDQPISGATITVISVQKGSKQRVTSNRSGFFSVSHLLPDTYNISAEAAGHGTCQVSGEDVYADQAVTEEFQLDQCAGVGTARPIDSGSILKTDRADVSTTLSVLDIQNLPNSTRNFTAFELLVPGAVSYPIAENTARASQNPQRGLQIDQNGQHYGGSAFQLDGTDNRDPIAGLIVINPTLESISEMKVTTQNFDAEFGQALAGLVTAQTRSGSNSWHGSLFEYRNSDWAQASPPNLNNANVANNPFKINQFGGSIGGPIIRSRLFIFGDYQGNRRAFDIAKFANVPTATVFTTCLQPGQACDLSDYKMSLQCPTVPMGEPDTCPTPISGMTIPQKDLSAQAVSLLRQLPMPNFGAAGKTFQNYTATGVEPWNDDEFDVRVDQSASTRLKLFGRYSFFDSRLDSPAIFGDVVGGIGLSSDNFAGNSRSRDHSASGGFDYLFSADLTTDFRFGFYRYHVNILPGGLNSTPATAAGIPGLNLGDSYTSGMPGFVIQQPPAPVTSTVQFGYSQEVNNCNCPLLENEQQFQWANNWTKVHDNHTFKWGVDLRYAQNLRVASDRHRAGVLQFSPLTTAIPGVAKSGLGLASFLLGSASNFSRYLDINHDFSAGERQHRYFFYGQDTWRATSRFTLTYGLRWELYMPQSVSGAGQGGFLDPHTGIISVAGYGSTNLQGNVQTKFTNFAPRLGFAYQVLPKTVVRAAYGRSFDLGSLGAVFGDSVTQNLPVLAWEQFAPQYPGEEVYNLAQPAPPVPSPNPLPNPLIVNGQINLNGVGNVSANVLPTRLVVPTIDAWNVSVQHEFNSSTSLELAYVANKATHIFPGESSNSLKNASYNLNQATLKGFEDTTNPAECQPNSPGPNPGTPGDPCASLASSRQPFFSSLGWTQTISYFGNNASSAYESLQVKLDRRFSHSFEFRAAYTWSRGSGYVEDYFAVDPRVNYGVNDFDRTHAFSLATLWDLPVGRGKKLLGNAGPLLNRVVGGWAINTISYAYSGLPFTPTYMSGECAMDADTGPCRPNLAGPVQITGKRSGYFSAVPANCNFSQGQGFGTTGPVCGPWQRPMRGAFGTAGRNSLRGPSFFDTDLALLKNVALSERAQLQFRTEVSNLFNRVNLGLPNPCVDCGAGTSGVISLLANNANMRQFRFALRLQF